LMAERNALSASGVARTLLTRALAAEETLEEQPETTTAAVIARLDVLQHQMGGLAHLIQRRQYGGPWH
jgi:hypothetical protein